MLHGDRLLFQAVLHILALLAIARTREGGEQATQRPLGSDLHFRQSSATGVRQLDRVAHFLLEEPILLGVPAAEEERCGRGLLAAAQLLPDAPEGGDAGAGPDHDHRHVLLWEVQRRWSCLRQHHVPSLHARGKPPGASAVEAAVARRQCCASGQAAGLDELLDRGRRIRQLMAGHADAQGDAQWRGLGGRGDRELAGLLPRAMQQEVGRVDLLHPEHFPKLVHLAAHRRPLKQFQRLGICEQLGHVLTRREAVQRGLQGREHLLAGHSPQVAVPCQCLTESAGRRKGFFDLQAGGHAILRHPGDELTQVRRGQAHEPHRRLHISGIVLWEKLKGTAEGVLLQGT
mmetsp:Transcript_33644/g.96606  ORF Transcript_33644/g.96606 Transcript_33644/m.96606 type:complete len:345 (-) Transcript_33644:1940-2974(-)